MKNGLVVFFICFFVAFGGGYLFYHKDSPDKNAAEQPAQTSQPAAKDTQQSKDTANQSVTGTKSVSAKEGEIFAQRGCIQCHSVASLDVHGGQVGPDLSQAFKNVPGKHNMPLEQFLTKPDSAVMSGVIGSKPLTDDEKKAVIAALKAASEK